MAESILDRLDRDPGGARQYVATLLVAGDASRAQVADALALKYDIPAPTGRSVSKWKNEDPELRELIRQMEAAKRDVAAGDDPRGLLPRQEIAPAAASERLFTFAICSRPFAELVKRGEAGRPGDDDGAGWGFDDFDLVAFDADAPDDVLAVLTAEHETAAEFEADCLARLGDFEGQAA